jgi:hypothetical protein
LPSPAAAAADADDTEDDDDGAAAALLSDAVYAEIALDPRVNDARPANRP